MNKRDINLDLVRSGLQMGLDIELGTVLAGTPRWILIEVEAAGIRSEFRIHMDNVADIATALVTLHDRCQKGLL